MTACSPAVFHPAPAQEAAAEPALAEPTEEAEQAEQDGEDAAPLPALAAEVKSARESQREAAAEGASALEAAHQQHQEELAAEEARLAAEQAEAEAEIERQRLEDQAAQEAARDQDGSTEEREDDADAEAPTEADTPAESAPEGSAEEGTGEGDTGEEDTGAEDAVAEDIVEEDGVEEDPAPSAPSPEEPSPDESEPVQPPDASTDAPSFTGDLDDYLEELAAHYPGDISISVAELGGQGRTGSTAGGESRVSASTYKVFVAYGILDRVESGELDWADPIDGGRDRATCFADMLSVSDNPCADDFREELGWEGLRDIAAETGGPATDFIPAYARTSANDLTAFMTRLESGALEISEASRSRLLGALESNIFRKGIGAGSAGTVLNKVGFIDGYLNDTAIVRHPQGSYVLSIMSEGSDWTAISSITSDVEAALY
ncbi:serine hydrolase [Nesterenkonia aurantiaca]|uniref:serine hydrolase n=1 Tax=Nesterenkonia aurantiaca TaxID=1436010 RepID=UPI003EE7FB94